MTREGCVEGKQGMMMLADNNANTLAWGRRRQIRSPSPEINANVMITDRGSMQSRRPERERSKLFSAIYYPVF